MSINMHTYKSHNYELEKLTPANQRPDESRKVFQYAAADDDDNDDVK